MYHEWRKESIMAKYRKLGRTSAQRKALLRNQVTALLNNGKIVTTEAKAKEVVKIAEGLIALAVKEKDNFEMAKVQAKVPVKDKDGKRVKEVVDGKKVTKFETIEKEIKKDLPSRLHARRQMLKVLMPVVEGTIKDIIGKWNAQDLVANREEATNDILEKLVVQMRDKYINVTGFQIININYSDVFERAIESKVTAEQEALKAKNKTVQIQEEAKQKVISAEAEAKSMSIRANALTQNRALVQYEAVQKWDGKMPQYMMGNSVPFINIKQK